MATTKIQKNGNIHLPQDVQDRLDLKEGDELLVTKVDTENNSIVLQKFKN